MISARLTNGTAGNGNMCPRVLSNLVGAINRANAAGVIKVAMFDDTGAYPGARNTFLGLPQDTPFDLSDQFSWDEVIWKRNIRIWHDTVPSSLWFRLEGKPVIAFGSHVDTARLQAAQTAGCSEVMPRSRLAATLPQLLGKHLGH